jgi:hypothetical protein
MARGKPTEKDYRKWIDQATYEQLYRHFVNARLGDPLMSAGMITYFSETLNKKLDEELLMVKIGGKGVQREWYAKTTLWAQRDPNYKGPFPVARMEYKAKGEWSDV